MAQLTIDTDKPITARDAAILRILLGEVETAKVETAKVETAEVETADAVARAIKAARALVRSGDATAVQKGLEAANALRVSEMTEEQAGVFLEAVS